MLPNSPESEMEPSDDKKNLPEEKQPGNTDNAVVVTTTPAEANAATTQQQSTAQENPVSGILAADTNAAVADVEQQQGESKQRVPLFDFTGKSFFWRMRYIG